MNKVKCHYTDHHHRWFRLTAKQGLGIGCEYCDEQFVLEELFDIYYDIIGPAPIYVLDEALIQAIGDCLWGERSNCSLQSEQTVRMNGGTTPVQPLDGGSVQATYSCLSYSREETDRLQRGGHLSQSLSEDLTSLDYQYQGYIQSLAVQQCEYATAVQGPASKQAPIGHKSSLPSLPTTGQPGLENTSVQVGMKLPW